MQDSSVAGALARFAMSQIETFQKQSIAMLTESQEVDAYRLGQARMESLRFLKFSQPKRLWLPSFLAAVPLSSMMQSSDCGVTYTAIQE